MAQKTNKADKTVLSARPASVSWHFKPYPVSDGGAATEMPESSPEARHIAERKVAGYFSFVLVTEHRITDFLATLKLGLEWIGDAGKKLVKILDDDPDAFETILEEARSDWLTRDVLRTIEAIGRGQIAPETMFLPQHVAARLAVLPLDQQIQAIKGVEVANPPRNGKGGWHRTTKSASDLTPREAQRAIGPNGIRPADEQCGMLSRPKGSIIGKFQIVLEHGKEPRLEHIINGNGARDYEKQRVRVVNGCALIELYT